MMEYKMLTVMMIFFFFSYWRVFSSMNMLFFCLFFYLFAFPLNYNILTPNLYLDSLSYSLLMLSLFIVVFMYLSTPLSYKPNKNLTIYYFILISFFPLVFFSFCSNSLFFFYFFFEASLIPTFILISGWGYQYERVQAVFYFLVYTIFASLPFLFILTSLDLTSMMFFNLTFFSVELKSKLFQFLFFFCISMAFLVKMPIYFFHLWLPKAHVEAPVTGSMILAAILLKLGGYGLIRLTSFFFLLKLPVYLVIFLSCFSLISVGLICMSLMDMKSLVAYSSVSHMAMSILGIFNFLKFGSLGSVLMFLSHGVCSSGMFYFIGVVYNSSKSRSLFVNKGLSNLTKSFSLMMFMLFMPNMAVPLTMNLFSEIYLLMSFVSFSSYYLVIILLGMLLVAYFTMMIFSCTSHGASSLLNYSLMNFNLESFLILTMHIFLLNVSFLFVSVI